LFLLIQLVPTWALQTNPPTVQEPQWNSPQTRALAQRACFDCHSNQSTWPWYSRVAPVSWLVTSDVIRGRRALNFSEWGLARQGGEGGEFGGGGEREGRRGAGRGLENGSMPPWYYIFLHPSAQLTDAEKQQLIQGLQAIQNNPAPGTSQ
jgi:hypothetical protein